MPKNYRPSEDRLVENDLQMEIAARIIRRLEAGEWITTNEAAAQEIMAVLPTVTVEHADWMGRRIVRLVEKGMGNG